jgi:hypothetical protein
MRKELKMKTFFITTNKDNKNYKHALHISNDEITSITRISPYDDTEYHYIIRKDTCYIIYRNGNKIVGADFDMDINNLIDALINCDENQGLKPHIKGD